MERRKVLIFVFALFVLFENICCLKRKGKHNQKQTPKKRQVVSVVTRDEVEEDGPNCDATDANFNNFWTFEEALTKDKLDIKRTRFCRFTRANEGCVHKFTRVCGHCPLGGVMIVLFGEIDLMVLSKKFIVPGKFQVTAIEANQCNGMKVSFTIRNQQEHTLACDFIQLKKGGTITVSWEKGHDTSFQDYELSGGGPITTKDGSDYSVKIAKEMKTDSVNVSLIPPNAKSVSCSQYASLFGLDFKTAFTSDLKHVPNTLQVEMLSFENPASKGVVFPGESFEFHLMGNVEANALLSGSENSFLVIQYFKVERQETDGKPAPIPPIIPRMVFYVPFSGSAIRAKVKSITGLELPPLTLFNDVKSFAFCAANKAMFMLLHDDVGQVAEAMKTENEKEFAVAGVTFVFKKTGLATSGLSPQEAKFTMAVLETVLILTTPDRVSGTLGQLANMVWKRTEESYKKVKDTKGGVAMLDNIVYTQQAAESTLTIGANLTKPLTVAGPFALNNVTLQYRATQSQGQGYGDYGLFSSNTNSFLEEESTFEITELEDGRYLCLGDARIYSLEELQNRTGGNVLKQKFLPYFISTYDFSFVNLSYNAIFGNTDAVVRIKGHLYTQAGKSNKVEILYWQEKSQTKLVLGMLFENARLDKVVNHVFGEQKMTQTWMTFDKVGVVISSQKHDKEFDDEVLNKLPKVDDFQIIATGLQLDKWLSNDTYKRMAYFLSNHFGNYMNIEYKGQFGVSKNKETNEATASFSIRAEIEGTVCEKEALFFENLVSEIKSIAVGEVSRIRCTMNFKNIGLKIPGVIFVDGSAQLNLKIAVGVTMQSDKIIDLGYVMLNPLDMLSPMPSFVCPKAVTMRSPMQIGTNPDSLLHFTKGNSEQYADVDFGKFTTFITKKSGVKFEDILSAFKFTDRFHFLRGAKCFGQTSVAYSGGIRAVWIPEIDEKVKSGLNFFCSIELPKAPLLDSKCTLFTADEMSCRIQFPAALNLSNGNFRLSFSPTNDSFGPTLRTKFRSDRVDAKLVGYAKLPGVERSVELRLSDRAGQDGTVFEGSVTAEIYDELEVRYDLTLHAETATEFTVKYDLNVETNLEHKLKPILNGKIEGYYKMYKSAIDNAKKNLDEVNQHLSSFQGKMAKLVSQEKVFRLQIRALSYDIDAAALTLSKECLDECKTISLPSLTLDDSCVTQTASNARCYRWGSEGLKALDVIQLIKCQAKKMSSYLSAKANKTTLEVLMHGLVKAKADIINQEIFVEEYTKLKDVAEETDRLVKERLSMCKDLYEIKKEFVLDWFKLQGVKSSGQLKDVLPPSFPFETEWTVLNKKHKAILNGTFLVPLVSSLADEIIKSTFATKEIRYAIDQSTLRYQQQKRMQNDIKHVLKKRQPVSEGAARRSQMQTEEFSNLLKETSRPLPQFSILSDSSIIGYRRLSPWARLRPQDDKVAKRDVIAQNNVKNFTIQQQSDTDRCTTAKRVLDWFHDISDGLNGMVDNYEQGKIIVSNARRSLYRKFSSAETFISQQANQSKADAKDRETMTYWLYPIKEGLEYWDKYHYGQLERQNRDFIPMLKDELNYSAKANNYGDVMSYIDYLGSTWSNAYRRENTGSRSPSDDVAQLSKSLKEIFSRSTTLDEAQPKIDSLRGYVSMGKRGLKDCR